MTIDDLLIQLTSRGYVKSADLSPPDAKGNCRCFGPMNGVSFWRSRATWQQLADGNDYVCIYPCSDKDVEGDTFICALFNPKNGVIEEWRIGEHWTGADFVVPGCRSFETALDTHLQWLFQVTYETD